MGWRHLAREIGKGCTTAESAAVARVYVAERKQTDFRTKGS
jgi:hypothetical protein